MHSLTPQCCLSLDLEVGKDGRIRAFGAVRADTGQTLVKSGNNVASELVRLDDLADGASFLLGHNLITFDLPHLQAAAPGLRLLELPVVDTLRLSPLAFPRNPYHCLVKHYQDGGLKSGRVNDPEWDARIALKLFDEECVALAGSAPDLLTAWHWLCTPDYPGVDSATDRLFEHLRSACRPSDNEAVAAIGRRLENVACATQGRMFITGLGTSGWAHAYTLAWLSVAGGNSVMPPWVRHQFPQTRQLVYRLRDTACTDPACVWCQEHHNAGKELKRWFGYDSFRHEPVDKDGHPMQQSIVEAAMAGQHVLGILPTGTGKSLCYQIPALSHYDKTGALTVVISPLVSLMADQVAGLEKHGIGCCVTVNGLLSMPERSDALDRIRLGDAGILLISPEQLRSRSLRQVLDQRVIGAWVIDEAHCLSHWGHDFRPDYRYVSRFIRENSANGPMPPVMCLTATAKPDVIGDITRHFRDNLNLDLTVFNGGTERKNLIFAVIPTTGGNKFTDILETLNIYLPPHASGGAIVFCATRQKSQDVADYLQSKGVTADYFHAGLRPETKKDVQHRFIAGELRVIAATNAFGMGIDKPDVRLVIHAEIPGSLENYMQEAGRAGRDRDQAHCILLYSEDDVERQFGMSARSRLTRAQIHGILRALRNLDRKKRFGGEVVATAGEILGEDEDQAFERDTNTDDTRVRTAVAWLEEVELLKREENFVQIFPSSLRVNTVEAARKRLAGAEINDRYRGQLQRIAEMLIEADADDGISTDELMGISGLGPEGVRTALYDLERLGIASNDTALTAFVHISGQHSSRKRLAEAVALEAALITHMREAAPDLGKGDTSSLHLRIAAQVLRDQGLSNPLPERLWRIIKGIAYDGWGEDGSGGSLEVRKHDAETARVTLKREWWALEKTAQLRRDGAVLLLRHLNDCLPPGSRGMDLLAETTLGRLLQAIESDLVLKSTVRETRKLMDRSLLWLHEMDVIRLNKGLAVFRPAMTIRLKQMDQRRGFSTADFQTLDLHYKGQILQIHVMVEYAKSGLNDMIEAYRLAIDYFAHGEEEFLARWLPGRDREIGRQTTPASWRAIVENLKNPVQQRIVADKRVRTNVLVLAGPGSGKTRVLVHRIAWLIRVMRENARGILALAYNRHAAIEIRRRLLDLIGDDARGVTVLTCHALAMRLAGYSFSGRSERPDDRAFKDIMDQAIALLRGNDLPPEEADERRERLLAGFRWILVDEYQDVGREQYELISAVAGRTREDDTSKLSLFAVGDDDQNIYSFRGASVEFIRQFEKDYQSSPTYLTANYRSTANIVAAANTIIEPARNRMKAGHPIHVNRARDQDPAGGKWETLDPVSRGRVQVLPTGGDPVFQARVIMAEFLRLASLSGDWDWSGCAVIARKWESLVPVRAFCEANNIPVQMANEDIPSFWHLRETRSLVEWLRKRDPKIIDGKALLGWVDTRPSDHWHDLLRQAMEEHNLEIGGESPVGHFIEWLAEWGQEIRRRQRGLLLLTAHGAKGLEFDHVAILDGDWSLSGRSEDPDAARRLYYVAMTRARQTLTLAHFDRSGGFQSELTDHLATIWRKVAKPPPCTKAIMYRYVRPKLEDIDLGFAGRRHERNRIHADIASLSIGDPLDMREGNYGRWELSDRNGHVVGRFSRAYKPAPGERCRSAQVYAVTSRNREMSDPNFYHSIKCETWETVIPEMVFEPIRQA